MKVLKQERTVLPYPLRGLGVHNRTSIGSGVDGLFLISEGVGWLVVGDHDCGCINDMLKTVVKTMWLLNLNRSEASARE